MIGYSISLSLAVVLLDATYIKYNEMPVFNFIFAYCGQVKSFKFSSLFRVPCAIIDSKA
jgi:hypothetical protein